MTSLTRNAYVDAAVVEYWCYRVEPQHLGSKIPVGLSVKFPDLPVPHATLLSDAMISRFASDWDLRI